MPDVKTSIHLDAVRNDDGQIVIRSRHEAQIHLDQSRLWDTAGLIPSRLLIGRPKRVRRIRRMPAWLYGDGDTFAPRRAKAEPRRASG